MTERVQQMREVTVVIPNWNGMAYLENCLSSLRQQDFQGFETILIDNGSSDGSVDYVREKFPEVQIHRFPSNTGFCRAVNEGIRLSDTPYVILLNNDTVCDRAFVGELLKAIKRHPRCFSCGAKMLQLKKPELLDDAGDYYCALGWAFAAGKGKPGKQYDRERRIFASCAGAAIYRRCIFDEIGLFDEKHFAYLEDIDVGYRARIRGYENRYIPASVVYHAGSATSGSAYNEFKVIHSSRNSVYLIYKNMPALQVVINIPFLLIGYLIKIAFFARRGFLKQYLTGLRNGIRMSKKEDKVVFQSQYLKNYLRIQLELWWNVVRRFRN